MVVQARGLFQDWGGAAGNVWRLSALAQVDCRPHTSGLSWRPGGLKAWSYSLDPLVLSQAWEVPR